MDTPTQATYEIAEFLSDEAKRAAVARTYTATRGRRPLDPYVCPRCESGMCPLGVALLVMTEHIIPRPGSGYVAWAVGEPSAWGAAERFADDWDKGYITDLAAALGVA